MNNRESRDELRLAEVTTTFKNDDSTKQKNYWPVSVLSTVWKVFERIMLRQTSIFVK